MSSNARTFSDDRAQHPLVDEGGDVPELVSAGAHEQELVARHRAFAPACGSCCSGRRSPAATEGSGRPCRAKAGSGGPAIPMALPPGLSTRRDFSRFSPPRLSSTRSYPERPVLEVLSPVVDDLVGAELADEVRVRSLTPWSPRAHRDAWRVGSRSFPRPPLPPWMRTFWPGLHVAALDQRLPGGQRDQRQGCRFHGADRRRCE